MTNDHETDGGTGWSGSASDTFTETRSRSWFSRIGSSLTGLLIGPLVVLAGIVLLFWNEGRAVATDRSLAEGAGRVVSIAAGTVDPADEGRLVHVGGPVTTGEKLRDGATGVTADGLRLVRTVQVYQWRETSKSETHKKLGGGEETVTTHTYALDWTDHPVDGSAFKQPDGHRNPPTPVAGETITQSAARLGAFALTPAQAGRLGRMRALPVDTFDRAAVQRLVGIGTPIRAVDGRIHVGADPMRPQLGDLRISYEVAATPEATVVAARRGAGFAAFTTSNGRTIDIFRDGLLAAEQVFDDARADNTLWTWVIRLGGVLILAFGFGLVLGPLSVVADVIPLVGDLVGGVSSMVAFAAAALVGSATVAVAWFAYRPLLAAALIVAGIAVAYGLRRLAGRRAVPTPAGAAV